VTATAPVRWRPVLAVGLLVAGSVLSGCDREASPPSCVGRPTGGTGITAPAVAPEPLRVVERGTSPTGPTVSIGVVIENPGPHVAYRTVVTFRPLDAGGRDATAPGSGELLRQVIPVILPGQRVGAGAWTYVGEGAVASVDVELTGTQWWPAANDRYGFATVTADVDRVDRSSVESTTATVHYDADSGYCAPTSPRGVATVFRDAGGSVVGGSFSVDRDPARCRPGRHGETAEVFRSMPDRADPARTSAHPYCDPEPPAPGSPGASGPVN
jgi:hypothetical protein